LGTRRVTEKESTPFARIIKDCREEDIPFPHNLVSQFERAAIKLNKTWGRLATADYLYDLIFASRPGRRGFPPEVAEEILALKNLHDERYENIFKIYRDPFAEAYVDPTRGNDSPKKADISGSPHTETPPKGPSGYSTRPTTSRRVGLELSATLTQLMPQSVRNQLTEIRASRTLTGRTTRVPAPTTAAHEILLDAERLLEEEHMNSGAALLEIITTAYPGHSPYAYVRLMEIYFRLRRREDYDWVCQRMSEQYDCEKIEWDATNDVSVANAHSTQPKIEFRNLPIAFQGRRTTGQNRSIIANR
jgi:hypothetical protein